MGLRPGNGPGRSPAEEAVGAFLEASARDSSVV